MAVYPRVIQLAEQLRPQAKRWAASARGFTLGCVDDDSVERREGDVAGRRSELQAVETGAALLLGALAFVVVEVLIWLVKTLLDVTDPGWSGLTGYGFWVAAVAVVGVLVIILRMTRAWRRGL